MSASPSTVLIVASQFGQKLDFFDADTYEKLKTIEDILAQPHEMVYDANRRKAYLTHTYRAGGYGEGKEKGHELSVIDVASQKLDGFIDISPYVAAHDVDFNPITDRIYAGVELEDGKNGLIIIDPETRSIVGNVPTSAPNTHWLSVTPDGSKAYLVHKEAPFATVVDLQTLSVVKQILSPGGCEEIACSPDGKWVYVAVPKMSLTMNVAQGEIFKAALPEGSPSPRLLKIDTATDEIVGELDFPEYLSAVRVGPDNTVVAAEWLFPDPDNPTEGPTRGHVWIVDGNTMTLRGSVVADDLPFTTRFSPDGKRAFTANVKTGSITVIDVATCSIITTLDNNIGPKFGGTHGMSIGAVGTATQP